MVDWNTEARKAVAHVESELSEAHRGTFFWQELAKLVYYVADILEE